MSQNDFTIANQGFPAFRADLNTALQALATNNSGDTEPSTMFANMWWYDSANNILYIRNEDNDAWIKFAELDQTNDKFVLSGTLQLDDGTVSAPALTFNSDTNMGLYRGGTDILKFVTAGTDRVTINASGNVGIGQTPSATSAFMVALQIGEQGNFYAHTDGTGVGSAIYLANNITHNTATKYIKSDAGSMYEQSSGEHAWYSYASGTAGATATANERMRIDSAGNVSIGTTAPQSKLDIASGNITISSNLNAPHVNFVDNTTRTQSLARITMDQVSGTAGTLVFSTTTGGTLSTRMIIDSSGSALFGGLTDSTPYGAGAPGFIVSLNNGSQYGMIGGCDHIANREAIVFVNPNGAVGSIKTNGSSTTFNTSSDYRLKENVNYSFDATTRLKQLKPARFNFIVDADTTVDGFLAHEVSSIVPEAIGGEKDGVKVWQDGEELPDGISVGDNKLDSDGNTIPYYQSIDQSKLVPLLVKTIQELEARITALEGA